MTDPHATTDRLTPYRHSTPWGEYLARDSAKRATDRLRRTHGWQRRTLRLVATVAAAGLALGFVLGAAGCCGLAPDTARALRDGCCGDGDAQHRDPSWATVGGVP